MVTGKPHKPTRFARFVLYPLGGVLFFIILTIVLILANGYRFTYNNGKVGLVKTGMLIVTTRPFDARITLNNKITKYRTSFYLLQTKISGLEPRIYDVEISKSGYRTWKDKLEILPNMVTWANYVLLFPNKLNISKIDVPVGNVTTYSENGRHILFAGAVDNKFSLKALDSNNLSIKDFWPSVTPTEAWLVNPQITAASFSSDNNRVLLKITNDTKNEYVIADASGNNVQLLLLNSLLSMEPSDVRWSHSNNNEMYVTTPNGLNLIVLNNGVISSNSSILADVISYGIDDGRQIFYVTKNATDIYSVGKMNLDGSNKSVIVESVVPSHSYKFDYSSQNNVLAVLNVDTGDLTAYFTGNANKNSSLKLSGGVTAFSWYKDGKKLFYWGKDFIKRYDWEKSKEMVTDLKTTPTKVEWFFDECHYLVTDTSGISVMDFDGSNVIPISETTVNSHILDSSNSNIIYSVSNSAGVKEFYRYIAGF